MTPSFFIMLSGQLIALDTQINWMGVGVSSKRIWIYRISHLSTGDYVTLYVRPPIIPAKCHNRRGHKIGRWIGTQLNLSLVISSPTDCVFNPSPSHAIPVLRHWSRLSPLQRLFLCRLLCVWQMVPKASGLAAVLTWQLHSFLVGRCRLSMETQSLWNLYSSVGPERCIKPKFIKICFFSPSSIESSWTSNTSLTTAEDVDVIFRTTIDPHHKAQHFLHDVKYYVPTYVLQFILYCSQGLMTHHRNGAPVFGWQSGLRGVCIFPLGYLPSFHMQKNLKLTALICADDL